jgi:hypothetical protein
MVRRMDSFPAWFAFCVVLEGVFGARLETRSVSPREVICCGQQNGGDFNKFG